MASWPLFGYNWWIRFGNSLINSSRDVGRATEIDSSLLQASARAPEVDLLHSWAVDLPNRLYKSKYNCKERVAPHFPSWICSLSRLCFASLALGDYQACSRFARSTIPEEKWGTTCSLIHFLILKNICQRLGMSKGKKPHFQLTCVAQKRLCLSSLFSVRKRKC